MMSRLFAFCLAVIIGGGALAQSNPFATAIQVNDSVITYWELDQRKRFLQLMNTVGDLDAEAEKALIQDRLRSQSARQAGVKISEEEVQKGMEEFAGRANLPADQFIQEILPLGISKETFRDFVHAGLEWRQYVRQKFGGQATVTPDELDSALALAGTTGQTVARLAEIVIPLQPGFEDQARALAADISKRIRDYDAFGDAARQVSRSGSAQNGGDLGWVPLRNLPPQVVPELLSMSPGQVTKPLDVPNAILIFQMRGLRINPLVDPKDLSIDYATLRLSGAGEEAQATARTLLANIDTCEDLLVEAQEIGPDRFARDTLAPRRIPSDIRKALRRLDANEVSLDLRRDGDLLFLMLCGRTTELEAEGREELRQALFTQRIETLARGHMQELLADADIVRP